MVDVIVGKVGRAHGLRGDAVVDVRTDEPERRFAVGASFSSPGGDLTVSSTHWHGARLLVRFEGVLDREAAEALRGVELLLNVPADERPDDPEEFYDHQLVGLVVDDARGESVGVVTEVLHLPAQDLLVVRRADGTDTLVPFARDLVPIVDLDVRRARLAESADALSEVDDDNGTQNLASNASEPEPSQSEPSQPEPR